MNFSDLFIDRWNKLRSGWRFAVFTILYGLVVAALSAAAYPLLSSQGGDTDPSRLPLLFVAGSVITLLPALAVGWFCGKYLEQVPFRALGASFTRGWLSHVLWGLVIGGITVLVAVVIAMVAGGLSFRLNTEADTSAILQTVAASLAIFAIAAAFEEALFRGYILQTFARSGLAWFAIVLTSVFFGLVHLRNPGAEGISTANTILAGIWLGVAYLKIRDLWFVWGLHIIWNWLQGGVFGIEVSGLTEISPFPVLRELDGGPAWLTGGEYGLEGGLACTVALVACTIAINFLPLKADEEMLALTSPPDRTSHPETA